MDWKKRSIKEHFNVEMKQRSRSERRTMFIDYESNEYILLRNADETIEFLKNATLKEIAWAFEVLVEMAQKLPIEKAETILNIFKDKLVSYPNLEDYSVVECALELKEAEETVEFRKNNK